MEDRQQEGGDEGRAKAEEEVAGGGGGLQLKAQLSKADTSSTFAEQWQDAGNLVIMRVQLMGPYFYLVNSPLPPFPIMYPIIVK